MVIVDTLKIKLEQVKIMKNITQYFRNAITAQTNQIIDFKNSKFITLSSEDVQSGKILVFTPEDIEIFFSRIQESENDEKNTVNIILALKTICTVVEEAEKVEDFIDDLSAVLLLPAKIDRNGKFSIPDEGKVPWIPREYLCPMIEAQLCVGTAEDYDKFLEDTVDEKEQIESWEDYLKYAVHMFEAVTKTSFNNNRLISEEREIFTDGKYYLFEDTTVNASFHILQLYNHLVSDSTKHALYDTLVNGVSPTPKDLFKSDNIDNMREHVGQMGGEYPLSPSQREAIIHFNAIGEGEVLAVNGPPGTGKTTLLQSIVADLYVKHALEKKEPPIIVASSTNNQAVTNIIDSFGKISIIGFHNLEERWINGVTSFATYFPSKGKISEAAKANYQYTNARGEFFFDNIESDENRNYSTKTMLEKSSEYFGQTFNDIISCQNTISQELENINKIKDDCFIAIQMIKDVIGNLSYSEYVARLDSKVLNLRQEIERTTNCITELQEEITGLIFQKNKWRESYNKLPLLVKIFKFFPYCKRQIQNWSYKCIQTKDFKILKRGMSIEEIENALNIQIDLHDNEIKESYASCLEKEHRISKYENKKINIQQLIGQLEQHFELLKIHKVTVFKEEGKKSNVLNRFDVSEINQIFDISIRYIMFWLSVHYYECQWLKQGLTLTGKQLSTNLEFVLDTRYKRLAMISPCFVMTFYMLPKQFLAYDSNERHNYYMYNYIDLLIADEAGQTSPEIAACSFSLAKRTIVVGDTNQIQPVWGTSRALDISMAIKHKVIGNKKDFDTLEKNGLNCSESSLMKIASQACAFNKYDNGLFLSEHRRCYNEIINYCNNLVYNGNLEPLRGSAMVNNPISDIVPCMGYYQIDTHQSSKSGCSRNNLNEAKAIVKWIKEHYYEVYDAYQSKLKIGEPLNEKNLFGIITPFKSQVGVISTILKKELPNLEKNITVGTVHTFQGAERSIIIFSSVYGYKDGCFFIDKDKSLMNVAVSRAKDSFLFFGDLRCLVGGGNSASGLLKKHIINKILS